MCLIDPNAKVDKLMFSGLISEEYVKLLNLEKSEARYCGFLIVNLQSSDKDEFEAETLALLCDCWGGRSPHC